MKKSMILSVCLMFVLAIAGTSQAYQSGPQNRVAGVNRSNIQAGPRQCKKLSKKHKRQMKKMALADGKVTPRERRMLRRQHKRAF